MAAPQKLELSASHRSTLGRNGVRRLRQEGALPAVLYGKKQEAISLQLATKDFEKVYHQAGESTLVYLTVDSKEYPTIIHGVTEHPVSGELMHADFYAVRLDEKISAMVPVVFEGESPAVKSLGGIFVRNVNELEVEALPADLPHEITVDISGMTALDSSIAIKDITLPNAKLTADPDDVVATINEPMSEEELQASLEGEATDVSAVEEIKKEEKPAEEAEEAGGETPAEEKKEE